MGEIKLTIELVPKSCWYTNVRSNVSKEAWDYLRKTTYKHAGYKCEICNGKGKDWPVECHEIWSYNDDKHIQKLERLIALCPDCHMVKHIGLAEVNGNLNLAIEHLMKINNWSKDEVENYLDDCWEIWKKRSKSKWTIDISILKSRYGIDE